jgi:hypothetical protein
MLNKIAFILGLTLAISVSAETTGNLITNSTFENGNSNGWTTSGNVQVLNDCCGSNYDLEFGDSGSIEQSFDLTSDTITQQMLNNGITLDSSVQVQNGECAVAGCWGGQGGADSFTIRLQIRDNDNEILATTTQTRTNVTGINGKDFTDSISYTGIGSNIGNIFISGTDANAPSTLGGANLDNISVIMTYDDTVLTTSQTTEINNAVKNIEETLELTETILPESFTEELFVEEITFEPEPVPVEEISVVTTEPEFEETMEIINVNETSEEPRTSVSTGEGETRGRDNAPTQTASAETSEVLGLEKVDNIQEAVSVKIPRVADQLKAVQYLVAKAMQSTNGLLKEYTNVNNSLFDNQPTIDGGNLDVYTSISYVDIRDIYPNNNYPDREVIWTSR